MKTFRHAFQLGLLAVVLTIGVSVAAVAVLPSKAFSQTVTSQDLSCEADNVGKILPSCTKCGTCEIADFLKLFQNLYEYGLQLAVPIGILFLIIGGVLLLTAAGRSSQIEMGKTIIRQSITGISIILVSWIIVDTGVYIITGSNGGTIFGKSWYSFDYSCTADQLTAGCSGSDVSAWQTKLQKLGYTVKNNGKYDSATVSAVKAFQTDAARLVTADITDSCNNALWMVALNKQCTLPAARGQCLATSSEVSAVLPTVTGELDAKTQSLLVTLNGADQNNNSYSALFQEKCLTK